MKHNNHYRLLSLNKYYKCSTDHKHIHKYNTINTILLNKHQLLYH